MRQDNIKLLDEIESYNSSNTGRYGGAGVFSEIESVQNNLKQIDYHLQKAREGIFEKDFRNSEHKIHLDIVNHQNFEYNISRMRDFDYTNEKFHRKVDEYKRQTEPYYDYLENKIKKQHKNYSEYDLLKRKNEQIKESIFNNKKQKYDEFIKDTTNKDNRKRLIAQERENLRDYAVHALNNENNKLSNEDIDILTKDLEKDIELIQSAVDAYPRGQSFKIHKKDYERMHNLLKVQKEINNNKDENNIKELEANNRHLFSKLGIDTQNLSFSQEYYPPKNLLTKKAF